MTNTGRNLELAKESGAIIPESETTCDPIYIQFSTVRQLIKYTSTILADKDAELAKKDAEIARSVKYSDYQLLQEQLSEANARNAMQQEALTSIKSCACGDKHPNWSDDNATYSTRGRIADICEVISASAESVAAWKDELLEPLQREVAFNKMLAENLLLIVNKIRDRDYPELRMLLAQVSANLKSVIEFNQATAETYERELKIDHYADALYIVDTQGKEQLAKEVVKLSESRKGGE